MPTPHDRPTLSVNLPSFGSMPGGDWRRLLDLARQTEDAGVQRIVLSDHVLLGSNTADYPWGRFPVPPDAPWLEPLTVITAMAAATSVVRFATGLLIAPLRPAPLLAKTVATLDALSGGRIDLGVGTGWQREEFEAQGLDFASRGALLDDTIGACRALWEQSPARFTSPSVSFEGVHCKPSPVQGRLPVWFGGTLHARNLRRIVELGDGWIPITGATTDDVHAGAERLHAALESAGRDPQLVGVRGALALARDGDGRPHLQATMAGAPALVDAGATDIHLNLRSFDPHLDDVASTLARMVECFRAEVG
ncbi:MAG: putative FMN-dependent monooxygenase [Acidimicrobiales bacterium]|nr:putative FMN-dependent monooxygenase [Acidimicrobiales bacterium]